MKHKLQPKFNLASCLEFECGDQSLLLSYSSLERGQWECTFESCFSLLTCVDWLRFECPIKKSRTLAKSVGPISLWDSCRKNKPCFQAKIGAIQRGHSNPKRLKLSSRATVEIEKTGGDEFAFSIWKRRGSSKRLKRDSGKRRRPDSQKRGPVLWRGSSWPSDGEHQD